MFSSGTHSATCGEMASTLWRCCARNLMPLGMISSCLEGMIARHFQLKTGHSKSGHYGLLIQSAR